MNPVADVVGSSGLHVFAEVALVLFLIAFGAIVTQLLAARKSTLDHAAHLPLEDDVILQKSDDASAPWRVPPMEHLS